MLIHTAGLWRPARTTNRGSWRRMSWIDRIYECQVNLQAQIEDNTHQRAHRQLSTVKPDCLQGSQMTSGSGVFGLRGFGLVDITGVFAVALEGVFDREARLRTPDASIDAFFDTEAAAAATAGASEAFGGVAARVGDATLALVSGSGAGAGANTGAADDAEVGDTTRAVFADGDATGGAGAASEKNKKCI